MEKVVKSSPQHEAYQDEVFGMIEKEAQRQREGIELIASENFVSPAVLAAAGSCLTNKYAEGLPGKRYYGGCRFVDEVEDLARERARKLYDAEWVNVQPHSGSQANAAVMLACLKPGDSILGFDLSHGGHLTHGSPVNFSGRTYNAHFYGVRKETGRVDYDMVRDQALACRPKMIIAGASAYSRDWDYPTMRIIADEVGAILLCDMAHPAGLIAAGLLENPLPHCHVVTTTTHKTLRGPRGGMILIGKNGDNPLGLTLRNGKPKSWGAVLDGAVFPGTQGGPLMHSIAAKAVAFGEALRPEFRTYAQQVIENAQTLANALVDMDYNLVSDGTDNHLMLIDLRNKDITGKAAEQALVAADITANKNMVPFDDKSPFVTSGIRLGTAAITTRGFGKAEMIRVAELTDRVIRDPENEENLAKVRGEVHEMMKDFPLGY